MNSITSQIEGALQARLHFLAIFVALAVPDICAGMESEDGRTNSTKYKAWYREWLGPVFPYLSDDQMYSLRCGIVHQGRAVHQGLSDRAALASDVPGAVTPQPYTRVLFTVPTEPVTIIAEGAVIEFAPTGEKVYLLDAKFFCLQVVQAALQWSAEKQNDLIVQRNMVDLFRFRPEGYGLWNYPVIG